MSSISAERSILGATTNPPSAYRATSTTTTAEMRKALAFVIFSKYIPPVTQPADLGLSLAKIG